MKPVSNSFELSNSKETATNLALRANMMIAIRDLVEIKGWTQKEAAKNLNVTQPRISNLKNGKIDKFSVDTLMGMLTKLGFTFEFNYTPQVHQDNFNVSMSVKPP